MLIKLEAEMSLWVKINLNLNCESVLCWQLLAAQA